MAGHYAGRNDVRSKHQLILDSVWDERAQFLLDTDPVTSYIPYETKCYLVKEADYICNICKYKFDVSYLHVDHITPVSRGGTCRLENLQVLCQRCNLQKSNHFIDPKSYKVGYVIPINLTTDRQINNHVMDALSDPRK